MEAIVIAPPAPALYAPTPRGLDALVQDLLDAAADLVDGATLADAAEYLGLDVATLLDLLARAVASGRAATAVSPSACTLVAALGLEAF